MTKIIYLIPICLLYVLIGVAGIQSIYIPVESYFSLWLSGAFGFVILHIYGRRALPYLLVSSVLIQFFQFYVTGAMAFHPMFIALILLGSSLKVLQAFIAWQMLKGVEQFKQRQLFKQGYDVLIMLIGICFIPSLVTTPFYIAINEWYFNGVDALILTKSIVRMTLADTLGIFLLGPLIYSFGTIKSYKIRDLLILMICYIIPFLSARIIHNNIVFLIATPAAIIAANYIEVKKLIPFHIMVMFVIMWMATHNMTVFASDVQDGGYLVFILFAFVATLTLYFTSISFSELKDHKLNLEAKVLERTKDLENEIVVRRRTEEELKARDRLVDTILASTSIGITLIKDRTVVWVNEGVSQILGYSTNEIINSHTEKFYESTQEYIKVGEGLYPKLEKEGFGNIETRLRCKNGTVVDVLMQGKPIHENDLNEGLIFTFMDITSLKLAQKKLENYTQELEDINKELDAFAHSVAHDLKNPLNAVMGFSELLVDDYDLFEKKDKLEYLKRINLQANKMLQIIDTLLLLSGVRKENVNYEICQMGEIVANSISSLEEFIKDKKAAIEIAPNLPRVSTHANWLEVVWVNLISNAVKYGGNPSKIKVGYNDEPDEVCFWVEDNGKGIPRDKQASLFVEFVRIKYDKNGHGLGLSIVKRIVERLNGEVFVESEPGKGSRFGFRLPKHVLVNDSAA